MKQIITLIFLLSAVVFGHTAEQIKDSSFIKIRNEFGMNLYSLTEMRISNFEPHISVTNSFFTGVYYKHYFGKNGIRTSFDLFQKSINEGWNTGPYYGWTVGNLKAGELKIGYERLFGTKKLIPFTFADLIYNYSQEKGYSTEYGDWTWYTDRPYLIETSEFGTAIGIGLKYRPIKNLVITIEASYHYIYSISQDIKNSTYKNKGSRFQLNPIRIFSIGLAL
jgi:hypothetical protein